MVFLVVLLVSMMFLFIVSSNIIIMYLNLFDWKFFKLMLSFSFFKLMFFFLLLLVVLSVLLFLNFYLDSELYLGYFLVVLMIFVFSMVFLNLGSNYFVMILSWDLLGISSYFLVLFYNNWDSNIGSMNVALTNRLGDYFMFVFFSFFFFFNYMFNFYFSNSFLLVLMLILMGFTKSAQFPFSSWLPKAMSAPTPVSALVHSSTLVTAGLVLFLNFKFVFFYCTFLKILSFFGLFTMFFSSVMSLKEEDLKKVVALSTLSQMGFSVLVLGLGLSWFCLMHLVSHALFKSCLFIQIGLLIYYSFGQQDGRFYGSLNFFFVFVYWQIFITLFCLCGLFFSSGLISKDMILEFFYFNSFYYFFVILFFSSVFLTFLYSYRLFNGLLSFNGNFYYLSLSNFTLFMSLLLFVLSLFGLFYISNNLFIFPSLILMSDFYSPLIFVLIFFFFKYVSLKFSFIMMKYSFMVDYFALIFSFFVKNLKFIDLGLNKFLLVNFLSIFNISFNRFNLGVNYLFFFIFFGLFFFYY